MTNNGILE